MYRFDPTRPDARTARVEVDDALQASAGRRDAFAAKEEHVTEQGSRYIDFLVPGLLGMNLMGTGMWSIGFSVVNARLEETAEALRGHADAQEPTSCSRSSCRGWCSWWWRWRSSRSFAWLVFDVAIRGSIALFCADLPPRRRRVRGHRHARSRRASKTLEAVSGLMNVVMMPMWICSGVFFSYERFPDAVKPFIRALPLTALNDALRAVMNDGYGFAHVAPQLAISWRGRWSRVVGLKIFRWQ